MASSPSAGKCETAEKQIEKKAVVRQHLPSIQKQNDISPRISSLLNAPHKVNLPPRAGKQSRRKALHLSDLNDPSAAVLPINQRNGSIH